MRDHDALGNPGGARGEKNVRKIRVAVAGCNPRGGKAVEIGRREGGRRVGVPRRLRVEPAEQRPTHQRGARQRFTQQRSGRSRRQNALTAADLEHPRQSRRGPRGIERHVGCVGLQHAEHTHDRCGHLRHQQRDAIPAPAPQVPQHARQTVAAGVELAVGEGGTLGEHRRGFRTGQRPVGNQVLKQATHAANSTRWKVQAALRTAPANLVRLVHGRRDRPIAELPPGAAHPCGCSGITTS